MGILIERIYAEEPQVRDLEARMIEKEECFRDDLSIFWRSWMWSGDRGRDILFGCPCHDVVLLDVKDVEACKRYLRRNVGCRLLLEESLPKDPREWGLPRAFLMFHTHRKFNTLVPKFCRPGEEKWAS